MMQVYLTSILLFGLVAFVLSLLSIYLIVDNSQQQGYTYTFTSYINGVSARRRGITADSDTLSAQNRL